MTRLLTIPLCFILCMIVHEGGHYLAALCFDERLEFRFAWGKFCVPRFVWYMPYMERWKQKVVALAGFTVELIVSLALFLLVGFKLMWICTIIHLAAYPYYCGDTSDFNWLR